MRRAAIRRRERETEGLRTPRLRRLLLAIVFVVVLAVVLGLGEAAYLKGFEQQLTSENEAQLAETSTSIVAQATTKIDDLRQVMQVVAAAVAKLPSDEARSSYLAQVAKQYGFGYLGVAGPDGFLRANVERLSGDVSGQPYFQAALAGEPYLSDVVRTIFPDRASSGIIMAQPVDTASGPGALVAFVELDAIRSILNLESYNGEGRSYVFGSDGSIVMRTRSLDFSNLFKVLSTMTFGEGYSLEQMERDAQAGVPGIAYFSGMGHSSCVHYAPLPYNGWMVATIVPEQVVKAEAVHLTQELTVIGLAAIVSLILLLFALINAVRLSRERREATNAKSAFLANVSHEIRTPMTAIVGMSEILLRGSLSAEQRMNAQGILNAGRSLLAVINDILDFSKIESGRLTLASRPYRLAALLYDVTTIVAVRAADKPIAFFVEADPGVPDTLVGDAERVKQILLNLAGNAVKFTDVGSVRVRVSAAREGDVWVLRIAVSDTGVGIKPEDQKGLFSSFTRVESNRVRSIEGTGLGLPISQQLCRAMGGDLHMESEYGRGSTFTMEVRQGAVEAGALVPGVLAAPRVLLFEPIDVLRALECGALDGLGIAYEAFDTEDALIAGACAGKGTHVVAPSVTVSRVRQAVAACAGAGCGAADGVAGAAAGGEGAAAAGPRLIARLRLHERASAGLGSDDVYVPLFALELPRILNGEPLEDRVGMRREVALDDIAPLPSISVLIVDDNEVNIEVAMGLMAPYLMRIDPAGSGEEAIRLVQERDYDLVFMDHMMPGMDGIEATSRIRALPGGRGRDLVIIALTANAAAAENDQFKEAGFDGIMAKPLETAALDKLLQQHFGSVNAEREAAGEEFGERAGGAAMLGGRALGGQAVSGGRVLGGPLPVSQTPGGEIDFAALDLMGSAGAYERVLETYAASTGEKAAGLPGWFRTDRARFAIEVHGLKSAHAAVGAVQLQLLAQRLEDGEGDESDVEELVARSAAAVEEARAYLERARVGLADEALLPFAAGEGAAACDPDAEERPHIVIVDDNPVNLDAAESVLSPRYRVTKLPSGERLLGSLAGACPDMVLLDIRMPGMDGYETLRALRENEAWRNLPVIFITGLRDVASEREGFRLGARDFIVKPFDPVVMLARVDSQMELHRYQTGLERIVERKTGEVEGLQHALTVSWAESIESRDGTTGVHVRNTTRYFALLIDLLSADDAFADAGLGTLRDDLLRASSLHDIGKIGISDLVLKKPARLTPDEFAYMKTHAAIGADMIQKIIDDTSENAFLSLAKDMARHHHERWDGAGYPDGLRGDEIPVHVQALTIADVFDALTAVRPYKRAFSFDEALAIMEEDRGAFYNPAMFDVFTAHRDLFRAALAEAPKDDEVDVEAAADAADAVQAADAGYAGHADSAKT